MFFSEKHILQRREIEPLMASLSSFLQTRLLQVSKSKVRNDLVQFLFDRDIDAKFANSIGVGYADKNGSKDFIEMLSEEHQNLMETLGLLDDEGAFKFKSRLMFPVRSPFGHIIGFVGRKVGDGFGPKWLDQPKSEYFSKDQNLYGISFALTAIRKALKTKNAILVEGPLDVFRLVQNDIPTAVSPLGTRLTEAQVRYLKRYFDQVFIVTDADEAGEEAAFFAQKKLTRAKVVNHVVKLPKGLDPDSFLVKYSREEFLRLCKNSKR